MIYYYYYYRVLLLLFYNIVVVSTLLYTSILLFLKGCGNGILVVPDSRYRDSLSTQDTIMVYSTSHWHIYILLYRFVPLPLSSCCRWFCLLACCVPIISIVIHTIIIMGDIINNHLHPL